MSAGVPNTVIFNYDLAGIQADIFLIQQDWNPNNIAKIDPSASYYTSVYYRFTGMGDVDYLRFKEPDNILVFENNF